MKARSFAVLCAVTLLVVVAAGVTIVRDLRSDINLGGSEKLFPALLDEADRLAVIILRNDETTLTIQNNEDGWSLDGRDGYPVRADAIRGLVLKLAGLEKVEAKTERPELYSRLGVNDVEAEGARSTEIELIDHGGGVLARLLVGKSAAGVGEEGGLYVRKPEESRSWLVRGRLAPTLDAGGWIERRITDIPATDVRSVRIVHPDGETIVASKRATDDEHFTLEGLSEGPVPRDGQTIDALAAVLSGLDLEDVRRANDIPFADDITTSTVVSTFDGLTVEVELTEHEGRNWIRVDAKADAAPETGGSAAARTAREITDRTKGWAYQVSAFAVAPWQKRKADLLKDGDHNGS